MFSLFGHKWNLREGRFSRGVWLAAGYLATSLSHAAPLDQPTPEVLAEARRIVQEMIESQRGPYSQIRWFCNDGSVQPPVAFACRELGGGRQHGEYSKQRQRLADLGWSVGTVFAALTFEEAFDSEIRQQRLRELALERYLTDIDNGWVLRRAQFYRGRVQVEDEDYAGRELLHRLLTITDWSLDNFLLVRELARVIPHGEDTDLARTVRRDAIALAELEPGAERWRVEIHTNPNASTAARLRSWLESQKNPDLQATGTLLASNLDLLYGPVGRRDRIDTMLNTLRRSPVGKNWADTVSAAMLLPAEKQVPALCDALSVARSEVFAAMPRTRRLDLVDTMQGVETEVQLAYQQLDALENWSRARVVELNASLLACAYGSGLLSQGELSSLKASLEFAGGDEVTLDEYRNAIARQKRAPAWALGTIRFTFAEALTKYVALDARAARFSDDVLRGSPLWMLGDTLKILSQDVDRLSGSVVELAGTPVSTAVALNSGIARGRLRIFATIDEIEEANVDPADIVALPETIAELSPVAGILTLGEGNALSHVQLLARNFGIPNVAVDHATIDLLQELAGQEVVLVVGSAGNVIMQPVDEQTEAALMQPISAVSVSDQLIEVPIPDLESDSVLPLAQIGRELSGKVIGPKAANLGELNRLFPGRVAPAVAIPFGIYARHLAEAGLMDRIRAAFAGRDAGTLSADDVAAELAAVRSAISAIRLSLETEQELEATMAAEFGEAGSYGVFVRSDTNVEDLPQFTGAGLNETVANVVGTDRQLAAIPRVWSSVLSPRALAWRSSVLANPAQIYASVLLMKSVPSTKSGVLVTTNLFNKAVPGISASTAWGVGGAVAGEAAESIVILDGAVELVFEAKSPYQRNLAAQGGVELVPAKSGAVLQAAEIQQLRELVAEVNEKYAPVFDESGAARPWDIEFGFVDGELTLFQIRPLVEKASSNSDALLRRLRPDLPDPTSGSATVRLDLSPGVTVQ
ncbi:MAG: hypothetical protein OEW68_08630 [Gammaproteobacteria bacterium]|nr:hypothetical protein [Gammaproteobacteria bacterium]